LKSDDSVSRVKLLVVVCQRGVFCTAQHVIFRVFLNDFTVYAANTSFRPLIRTQLSDLT